MDPLKFSVVIPLKDEEDNIADLVDELEPVMASLKEPWELICIDDGSTDKTLSILTGIARQKPFLKILCFDRNYGQSCAFDAGFQQAKGQWVITLDGDRQNDPRDIPKLYALSDRYDLICGCRAKRQDPWHKKVSSKLANWIRSRVCRDQIKDTGCSLKLYRTSALKKIKMYKGMHRFLPALFKIEGFRITEVAVNHRERTKGSTKYNLFNRSFNTIFDMLAVRWMDKRHLNYSIKKEIP